MMEKMKEESCQSCSSCLKKSLCVAGVEHLVMGWSPDRPIDATVGLHMTQRSRGVMLTSRSRVGM